MEEFELGRCDICGEEFKDEFTNGKTAMGPWANMCPPCYKRHGRGIGTGLGQKYQKQADGKWLKVAG